MSKFEIMKIFNPNSNCYTWEEITRKYQKTFEKWDRKLQLEKYIDKKTGKEYSLKEVVYGYIHENPNEPGYYQLLNTVNRSNVESGNFLLNIMLKDSNGKPYIESNGCYIIQLSGAFGSSNEYYYNPNTQEVISKDGKSGLNLDGSIGTIYDMIDRVEMESKMLSKAMSLFERENESIILRRGATSGHLIRNYGIDPLNDSAELIYKKLTKTNKYYIDEGFMSTSPDIKGGFIGQPVEYIIATAPDSSFGLFSEYSLGNENELLLNYGSRFEINMVEKNENGGIRIYLTQLSESKN